MTPGDFGAQLREEEAVRLRAGMPRSRREAVRDRLDAAREPRARVFGLRYVAAAAAVALVLLGAFYLSRPRQLGGLQVLEASRDLKTTVRANGRIEVEQGTLTLLDVREAVSLSAGPASVMQQEGRGVRILMGRVRVAVQHRNSAREPAKIFVSGGIIEVMGTHFTVTENASSGGSVALEDGRIRFRAPDGRTVGLEPGQHLEWPLPEPAVATHEEPPPAPVAPPADHKPLMTPTSADGLLHEVEILRSRHDYEGAARLLEGALDLQPAATRERLSFELGTLLTRQIGDRQRACAQWHKHRLRYPHGRYQSEVKREQRALGCGAPGTP